MLTALDEARLAQALAEAEHAIGLSEPNPRVGCVIGRANGTVLGTGFTQAPGQAHAEVMALRDAARQGQDVQGATAWVTLEPCAHHGRTPPCCDALISAGIRRVVVAVEDPFHHVAGQGLARMRAAGITVDLAEGSLRDAALDLNVGFFSRQLRGRPWVRLKTASSLDGRTALPDGSSQWITGPAARDDGHRWRRRASMVLTGIGTVLADNPQMTVRAVPTARQPLRGVLDSHLRTPPTARCLAGGGTVLFAAEGVDTPGHALTRQGAEIVRLSVATDGLDLGALIDELSRRQVNELHVEAGARLTGAWLRSGWVDEWVAYVAPALLVAGAPIAQMPPPATLSLAPRFKLQDLTRVDGDARLRLQSSTSSPDTWWR
ncbi:bifunctional diaminohydroxyphosphoribosylaminopyrimidine deaminase/5-amino-6-(5-phosphoribosylamino)uracil reductase RibD [Rubrivivax albus]|uniref:Riboflavin biosynthesis protein RibD n=1 Tax=Rubrivivax albus TaxID=2499835 RepID=A0A437JS41_9BURK|nr:bifunctional diaminohydroxyphosphoribosylaminopyrimidine deaminase/5-amino-6-(5-phosphoribosylamino)uracil reductase RibD [Rubrivivax albus]RVT49727.1 bifunctional diaminohydroxyphosphoribosylaminopyrimidine deaminase/5-amino-6-(5-phosphoribosylamino)uracil reductase RibD [Rubrivivax albus]